MLGFVLCDDNSNILNKLASTLESIFINHNFDAEVVFQTTAPEDVLTFLKNNSASVVILDINLKSSISGLEVAKRIREFNKDIYIIFTTAHLEYVMVAYKVKTFDYLAKPISRERLEETIVRLFDDIKANSRKYIRIDNRNTLISQDDITYIKKDGMKLVFHTDTKQYVAYNSFNKIESYLPDNFVRCHKSYIANINKIQNVESSTNTVFFNQDVCYIGPKYKNNLLEVLKHGNSTGHLEFTNNTK